MSLLLDVQRKMQLFSHQKVRTILDGEYGSVFKGRSMDFDDLREYVPGDDVKDIDWKASARTKQVLVKRYIAVRKHNVMLVVDTGRNMATTAPDGQSKRDISVLLSGIVASIVLKHADLISVVSGDKDTIGHLPLGGSSTHAERILQRIARSTRLDSGPSHLGALLEYVARTQQRRLMLIVISDEVALSDQNITLLRRLRAQHEIMYVRVKDALPFDTSLRAVDIYDVDDASAEIPYFLRNMSMVADAIRKTDSEAWNATTKALNKLAISQVEVASENEAVDQIVKLLERQKHVRGR